MHSTLFSSIWFWWEALFCQGLSQLNKVEAKATRKSPWTFGGPRKAWVVISWSRASLSSLPLDIRGRRGWTCNDDKGFLLNLTVSILSMGWKTYNFQEKNQYLPKLQLKLPYDLVIAFLVFFPRENKWKLVFTQKPVQEFHRSFIYYSWKLEIPHLFISRWMIKHIEVHL